MKEGSALTKLKVFIGYKWLCASSKGVEQMIEEVLKKRQRKPRLKEVTR